MREPAKPNVDRFWIFGLFMAANAIAFFSRFFTGETLLPPFIIGLEAAVNVVYWFGMLCNWRGYTDRFLAGEDRRDPSGRPIPVEHRRRELRRFSMIMGLGTGLMLVICVVWVVLDLLGYEYLT